MNISLVYTSRRANCIEEVVKMWLARALHPARVQVVVAVDADYREGIEVVSRLTNVIPVCNAGDTTCVAGWNAGAAAATGDVLIAVADDFSPPDGWDDALQACAEATWWMHDRVVWVADGYNPDIFTLGIITRRRYERFGYFFYPGYESLFSDTEHTAVARLDGVVIDARHLLFEHLHPDCSKRARDEVDLKHASTGRWKRGEMLFNLRRDTGFPLDAGPVAEALDASYNDLKFAVYVQAIRDDLCLFDTVQRVADDLGDRVSAVYICAPDEHWGGKPQTAAQFAELEEVTNRLHAHARDRYPVFLVKQRVADCRAEGLSRIQVETNVRNAAVEWIRRAGHQHVVIVDGDELWNPGLGDRLVTYVRELRPASVYTGMVPVIGLPGYPVEGALDKATIYIGPGAWLVECRGASGHRHELPGHDIVHFTATRRTMDEIVMKNRESGHADDPNYAFEEWIEKVLPNIRPGFVHTWGPGNVGLHMYRPYQVWNSCRNWTKEEWALLPNSVKPYLAPPPDMACDDHAQTRK